MNARLNAALVAFVALALAGCSSSTPAAKGTAARTATVMDEPLTMKEVAAKAGCSDLKEGNVQIYTKEAAICTKGGHDLYLYTFADDAARDNWLKVGKAAGAPGSFQQGTSWVIQTM